MTARGDEFAMNRGKKIRYFLQGCPGAAFYSHPAERILLPAHSENGET